MLKEQQQKSSAVKFHLKCLLRKSIPTTCAGSKHNLLIENEIIFK